jgi:hypothetical protein
MPAAPQLHFLRRDNCGAFLYGIPSNTKHILIGCLVLEEIDIFNYFKNDNYK